MDIFLHTERCDKVDQLINYALVLQISFKN